MNFYFFKIVYITWLLLYILYTYIEDSQE